MNPVVKKILLLLLMLAVMAYTVYNYISGRSEFGYFIIAIGMMAFFFINILNQMIQEMKHK